MPDLSTIMNAVNPKILKISYPEKGMVRFHPGLVLV